MNRLNLIRANTSRNHSLPSACYRRAYQNAALWAIGNGLVSTTLVSYLARQLGADAVAISWIIAAPHLVGVLRVFAPALAARLGNRKRFCVAMYVASGFLLLAMPVLCAPGLLLTTEIALIALVGLWCGYHLLEYLATVVLWSWISDLVPPRIRGRFIGRRERALALARIIGLLAGGQIADGWKNSHAGDATSYWIGYAIAAALGSLFLIAAVAPLSKMPNVHSSTVARRSTVASMAHRSALRGRLWAAFAPLFDRRYRRSCCSAAGFRSRTASRKLHSFYFRKACWRCRSPACW